jgi:hypothetical protein
MMPGCDMRALTDDLIGDANNLTCHGKALIAEIALDLRTPGR